MEEQTQNTAIIIHGAYGSPKENWFPWLKGALEDYGWEVFTPVFPTPDGQSLESWASVFSKFKKSCGRRTAIIGHSIGAAFALRAIEGLERPIGAAYLVSGFTMPIGVEKYDRINRTFIEERFNWARIRSNCAIFNVYQSDNDEFVKVSQAEKIANCLGIKPHIISGAGHFNTAAGYTQFHPLLKDILDDSKIMP